MSRSIQNNIEYHETFICSNCGTAVSPPVYGGEHRNHCPHCLYSLHVDLKKGDRRCGCRGLMEPISIWCRPSGEWSVIHRCIKCGFIRLNRIAGDDNDAMLLKLAVKPISMLPFPVEQLWRSKYE